MSKATQSTGASSHSNRLTRKSSLESRNTLEDELQRRKAILSEKQRIERVQSQKKITERLAPSKNGPPNRKKSTDSSNSGIGLSGEQSQCKFADFIYISYNGFSKLSW